MCQKPLIPVGQELADALRDRCKEEAVRLNKRGGSLDRGDTDAPSESHQALRAIVGNSRW